MKMRYDYLIVGSGLFGATFAHQARKAGRSCLVIDKRPWLGGNVYCSPFLVPSLKGQEDITINVHKYGAHIFHTNNKETWDFVNSFVEFNRYTNCPVANYKGEHYNLPFNMNTFCRMWPDVHTPAEAQARIDEQRAEAVAALDGREPQNLEEQALTLVGKDIFEKLIKEYTEKQWGRKCTEDIPNYQGNAVVNYTSHDEPFTRVIEHKHFEMFGQEVYDCPKTVISEEYSTEYAPGMEPYYPVNDERNNRLAEEYRKLAEQEENVIFGGRLAQYRYYDMAPVIEQALMAARSV